MTPTPATTSSRRPLALALATLAVLALLVLSLSTGEYSILSQDDGWRIFLAVRVPRTIALILSGAAMSMSGLVMQLVTQNRFAEPSTTGTTEWAGLGLLVIMIAWPGAPILVRMTCAITFAFAGTMVFFALLRRVSLRSSLLVPIMGMMLGAVVSAISTFIALETNTMQSVAVWFQGSFTSVYEGQYEILWIVTIVVAIVFIMADRLTAVSLGEDIAVSLGVNYHRMVLIATGLVAVATGVVTVVVGSLPFLGLIVPNLVSMTMGDNLRTKIEKVARHLYGAATVTFAKPALTRLRLAESLGMSHFPVCIAKTQFSFSDDPTRYGAAEGFDFLIRDIVINAGAEMIVAVAGDIMRMPGLPKAPQALNIDYVNGEITGLS